MTAIFARIMMTFNWLCPLGSLFFVTKHGPHGRYWDREWCNTARPPDKLTCAYVAVRMRVERIRRTWCVFISQNKISGKGRMGGREDGWRERSIDFVDGSERGSVVVNSRDRLTQCWHTACCDCVPPVETAVLADWHTQPTSPDVDQTRERAHYFEPKCLPWSVLL